MKILYGVRIGDEDWQESIITEVEARIPAATAWAKANGFDRLRVADIVEGAAPDFAGTVTL